MNRENDVSFHDLFFFFYHANSMNCRAVVVEVISRSRSSASSQEFVSLY
jgi:hypothetical protein